MQPVLLLNNFWFLLTQSIHPSVTKSRCWECKYGKWSKSVHQLRQDHFYFCRRFCWPPLSFLLMCHSANRLAFPLRSGIFQDALIGPANWHLNVNGPLVLWLTFGLMLKSCLRKLSPQLNDKLQTVSCPVSQQAVSENERNDLLNSPKRLNAICATKWFSFYWDWKIHCIV